MIESTKIYPQSGGFHGGMGAHSLRDNKTASGASGLTAHGTTALVAAMAGTVAQPTQPCPDCVATQQGAVSAQHFVNGAATAPTVIQASSAAATRRMKEHWNQHMLESLA